MATPTINKPPEPRRPLPGKGPPPGQGGAANGANSGDESQGYYPGSTFKPPTPEGYADESDDGYVPTKGIRQANPDADPPGGYVPGETGRQRNPDFEHGDPDPATGRYTPGSTKNPEFQVPKQQPQRSGIEDAAYRAGRSVGQARRAIDQEAARGLQHYFKPGSPARQQSPDGQPSASEPPAAGQPDQSKDGVGNLDVGKIASKAKSGDIKGAVGEAATELGVGKKAGDLLFIVWGILSLTVFVPPWVGLVFLAVFNVLLVWPKGVYKLTEYILDFTPARAAVKVLDETGLSKTKITVRGWEKALIILLDLVVACYFLMMAFTIMYAVCYPQRLVNSYLGDTIGNTVSSAFAGAASIGTGVNLSGIADFCKQFNSFADGVFSQFGAGSGNTTGTGYNGPISTGQWKDVISQSSQKYNIDTCIMTVVLEKESGGGNPNAIGHDNHNKSHDPFNINNPPLYGLDFGPSNYSHGIGITQVTIFPDSRERWPTPGIPSRTLYGHAYTIPELLNPNTSIELTAHIMADNLKSSGGDTRTAFRKYNGSGPRAENYATDAQRLFDQCKQKGP